ncbi:MAG: ATP-binding cassette domain-containing protein [Acidobacteriota bacterium]
MSRSPIAGSGARRSPGRPLARGIVALVVLVLGGLAALRMPMSYLPTWTFPELQVTLTLPQTEEVDQLTLRYVQPLESAIRAVGGIRGVAGEVGPWGAAFRVRLGPGVDPERKAARLESELSRLRSGLPLGAVLTAEPVGEEGDGPSSLVFVPANPESSLDGAMLSSLRSLPEVRAVEVAGDPGQELRLRVRRRDGRPAELLGALDTLETRPLGNLRTSGGDLLRVRSTAAERAPDRLPLAQGEAVLFSGSEVDAGLRPVDGGWRAHVSGRPGRILLVFREADASPLALSRALRRTLSEFEDGAEARFLVDESEPLRRLLNRLAIGLLAASLLGAAVSAPGRRWAQVGWHLVAPPLAAAAAMVAMLICGYGLDVTTASALALAVGSGLSSRWVGLASRSSSAGPRSVSAGWRILVAATLPMVVALVGHELGTLLSLPVRVFAVGTVAASLSLLLVPPDDPQPRSWSGTVLGALLRRPWAVVLGLTAAVGALLLMFGGALAPRPGSLSPAQADLLVRLRMPDSLPLEEAEMLVSRVEGQLDGRPEINGHWSFFGPRQATLGIEVLPEHGSRVELQSLAGRLEAQLGMLRVSAQVFAMAGLAGEALEFDTSLEDEPEAAEDLSSYRFILRSTDLGLLRQTHALILDALGQSTWRIPREHIQSEWGRPIPRIELRPRVGADPVLVSSVVDRLGERLSLPAPSHRARLPGSERDIVSTVLSAEAPASPAEPRRRREVLAPVRVGGRAFDPKTLLETAQGQTQPTVKRQDGTFVLPVTVRFLRITQGQKLPAVRGVHRLLRKFRAAAGVDLRRPSIRRVRWPEDRVRLLAIASALPLAWLLLAICRLDSVILGFASLVPSLAGLAAVAAWTWSTTGGIEELALIALACGLAATLPLSFDVASATRALGPSALAGGVGYRWLKRRLPLVAAGVAGWIVLLWLPTVGLDPERHPWAGPLVSAALAGAVSTSVAVLFLPVLLRSIDRVRFYDRRAARRLAAPPRWAEAGVVELEARGLAKVYGNGFVGLAGVDFRLEPGIVGLLGPNGAGKSTLLRLLCGLLEPSRGQVLYRGLPVRAENLPRYRHLVGFLPQDFDAYEGFTAEQFLEYWALERGLVDRRSRRREIESLLHQVGLDGAANRKVRELSGGMRRRIGIARALLGAPPILIVDEPTTGLDVASRNRLRESLLATAGERIILFSTHIAGDVAAAASRILLLNGGRLIFDGPAGELIQQAEGRVFEALLPDEAMRDFSGSYRITTRVRTLDGIQVRAVAAEGQELQGEPVRPNLEEAYLAKLGLVPQGDGPSRQRSLLDLGA